MNAPPVVLTIAGFDPSSGAGITADIKTIAAHGCYGISCITALTVQSTVGVCEVSPVPATLVRHTLQELAADLPIAAIHIGMLGSGEVASAVADFLTGYVGQFPPGSPEECHPDRSAPEAGVRSGGTLCSLRSVTELRPFIVLDPILRSSSGADLLDAAGREVLLQRLAPLATVITPNLDEASVLTGLRVATHDEMAAAADHLHQLGARAVVVKGGHLEGTETIDLLSQAEPSGVPANGDEPGELVPHICPKSADVGISADASNMVPQVRARAVRALTWEFRGRKKESRATHGTGCAFASALACNLALGKPLPEAVGEAKQFVAEAIAHAYPLGRGHGPMHHLFRLEES